MRASLVDFTSTEPLFLETCNPGSRQGVHDDMSSTEQATPGQRDRVWSTVANVALIFGALVTVYLVYLAFTSVP